MKKTSILCLISVISVFGCKKTKNAPIQNIYINVPFETNTLNTCYLYDTILSGSGNIYNKIEFKLQKIQDFRAFGSACQNSTGGTSNIYSVVNLNGRTFNDTFHMSGCSNNNEWDTINVNAPHSSFDRYKLYLLKLNPYDRQPTEQTGYSVKYVFKKK
jgi:hypothetical protein